LRDVRVSIERVERGVADSMEQHRRRMGAEKKTNIVGTESGDDFAV
jgi:hypothetical protein